MPERVPVSPVAEAQVQRRSSARSLSPHRTVSNAAVQRIARGLAPAPRRIQRCAGGCTCGGACHGHDDELEEELRAGSAALQRAVATRRTLAREQDPGAPELPEMQGLSCGFKDGKPFCAVQTGKGEPLEIDPSSLSPKDREAALDPKRPKSCPPERWNPFWESCRPPKTTQEQPFVLPPAPLEEKGDFPLPDTDQMYA